MRHALTVLGIACALSQLAWAGDINPPGGPVAPTMKPLDQVEPRTPITALPVTITESGSYYLTGNLSLRGGTGDGITIATSNVTLDLCGFTLTGPGSGGDVTGSAIVCQPSGSGIVIRNGILTLWPNGGILADTDVRSHIERMQVINNTGKGIVVAEGSVVSNCDVHHNTGYGIAATASRVEDCVADYNDIGIIGYNNSLIVNNHCQNNTSTGIMVNGGTIVRGNNCAYSVRGIHQTSGSGTLIEENAVINCTEDIDVTNAIVKGNVCSIASAHGILVRGSTATVENNLVHNTDIGIGVAGPFNVGAYFASNRAANNTTANYDLQGSPEGTGSTANIGF